MTARWLMTARLPSEALVVAAIHGDEAAVDALAKAWLPHVYRWCHRLGGPGFDAEDSAHEILMVMVRRLPGLKKPEQFPSWLFGITRRVLANHRRRAWWRRWMPQAILKDQPSEEIGPERTVEAQRAARRVWTALDALSEQHREVIVLCELEERSGSEAAALLDIPLGTVKSRLRAARVALKDTLEEQDAARTRRAAEVR